MAQETKNIITECRGLVQELRENSYFERFMQRPAPRNEEAPAPAPEEERPAPAPESETAPEPAENQNQEGDVITNIRKSIIEGLAAYADNINDPTYQTLKKLFAIIDKRDEESAQTTENNSFQQ